MVKNKGFRYSTPFSRWAGVGPYYAMFPSYFADRVITKYTKSGDWVLDPFAGRGTTLFSAATKGRFGIGVEINPLGWVYGQTKLRAAERDAVEDKIRWLGSMAPRYSKHVSSLPVFFHYCFNPSVCDFLLAARDLLNWRQRDIDRTAMALLLIDLHGKRENSLSNQMRQTKAMSPQYAIRWWAEKGLLPPDRNPVEFMLKKVAWRYAKGYPVFRENVLYLGDSTELLGRIRNILNEKRVQKAKLLLTSPPYYKVTNYFYDQWLRLWLLGGPPYPLNLAEPCKGKFGAKKYYKKMLHSVFMKSKPLLLRDAVIYVRTDAREFTFDTTLKILTEVFPWKKLRHKKHTLPSFTQTSLYDNKVITKGEVDLVFW